MRSRQDASGTCGLAGWSGWRGHRVRFIRSSDAHQIVYTTEWQSMAALLVGEPILKAVRRRLRSCASTDSIQSIPLRDRESADAN